MEACGYKNQKEVKVSRSNANFAIQWFKNLFQRSSESLRQVSSFVTNQYPLLDT